MKEDQMTITEKKPMEDRKEKGKKKTDSISA